MYSGYMSEVSFQESLETLLRLGKRQQVPKGQVLQFSTDGQMLAILDSGYVKRYSITNDGDHSIQSIYGSLDIFPLTPTFKLIFNQSLFSGSETYYYEAMSPVVMYTISGDTLQTAVQDNPGLYKDLFYVCGVRLKSNIQRLENRSLKTAEAQVAHQLAYFADKFGEQGPDGITITIPLTHQTIANVLNVARETVSINMQRLQDKGLLVTQPKLTITDIDALRHRATL